MIEPPVRAFDEAVQRFISNGKPSFNITAIAGKLRKKPVVLRQGGRWHLVPSGTPQQHGAPECGVAGDSHQVAIPEPHNVQWHVLEVAEVGVGRHQWRYFSHAASRLLSVNAATKTAV
jgi:hypothetical protein